MRKLASGSWSLAAALLVTIAGILLRVNILIALMIALIVAGAVFYWLDYRVRPDRRQFLQDGVDASYLVAMFKGMTTLQAEKAAGVYIGKWMKVVATVYDVTTPGKYGTIMVALIGGGPFLNFRKKLSQLDMVHRGDRVEVQGQVSAITANSVILDYCELLSVERPSPPSLASPSQLS